MAIYNNYGLCVYESWDQYVQWSINDEPIMVYHMMHWTGMCIQFYAYILSAGAPFTNMV